MTMSRTIRGLLIVMFVMAGGLALRAQRRAAAPPPPPVDTAAALRAVAPDLDRRIAQFKQVQMPFNATGLSARERQLVGELVAASQALERAYWRQSDPQGLALYDALERVKTPLAGKVRHYLFINGSRFDLVDENLPFVVTAR